MGPRLPYGSWEHGLSLDTRPPMYPAVTGHGLKLSSSLALEELQTGGVCAGRPGGGVWDGAQLTQALQLMQGEARGGSPTETEVRWGEVIVYVQPGQFWGQGQTGQGPQPAG